MIILSKAFKLFLFALVLVITLAAGLHPKDFSSEDIPTRDDTGALNFTKYSVATSDLEILSTLNENTFQVVILLHVSAIPVDTDNFSILMSISDAYGSNKMLLGQWKSSLILMSGDDFSDRYKLPRITVDLNSIENYEFPSPTTIKIVATPTESSLSIAANSNQRSDDLHLSLDQGSYSISLGNTLDRKQGWNGVIENFEFDFFSCTPNLKDKKINECESKKDVGRYIESNESELVQRRKSEVSINSDTVILQPAFNLLDADWLSHSSLRFIDSPFFIKDVALNIFGFVPISLMIFIILYTRMGALHSSLTTIIFAFLLSLFIESMQIYIPSRTSSIIDLVANSSAAVFTALVCFIIAVRKYEIVDKAKSNN